MGAPAMLHKLIHLVALLIGAEDCKQSKCSSTEDQFGERQISTMEYYTAIQRMSKLSVCCCEIISEIDC